MKHAKEKWGIEKGIVIASVEGIRITNGLPGPANVIAHVYPWAESHANLIVSAVNACAGVNPDNPQIVAESISDLYEALKAMMLPQQINNGKVVVRSTPSSQAILMSQQALAKVEEK